MDKARIILGSVGLAIVVLGFSAKSFYRDHILSNEINDFGIQGFSPSYFYVIGFSLLLMMNKGISAKYIVLIVTLASVSYELFQYFRHYILDVPDILASFAGGITSIIILQIFIKKLT